MKNEDKNMKRMIAILLLSALCASLLCGCGAARPAESAGEKETAPPEEVWTASFQETAFPEGAEPSLWALSGDAVYAACREKIADGVIPEGKTPDYEGEYDVMGWRLYRVDPDGTAVRLSYASLPAPEDTEGRAHYSASSGLEALLAGPDGGLLAVEQQFEQWGEAEDPEYRNTRVLRRLDGEGNELSRRTLDFDGEYLALYSAAADDAGRLYVPVDGRMLVYGESGEPVSIDTGGWIYDTVRLRDGRVAAEMWSGGMQFFAVDAERGELEPIASTSVFADELIPGGGDYDYYYTYGTKLYGFRLDGQEAEPLLDWLECDLSASELLTVRINGDGSLSGVFRETEEDAPPAQLLSLRKAPADAGARRTELTLGALSAGEVSEAALRFNRSQDHVRIRVKDYSDFINGGDYEAGLTKLLTEIMAGDMPDLLALESLPYAQLAARGLLEDLYPYLDADEALRREDYFENVLKSMEVGGRLCEVSPGFTIVTAVGSSDVVGDTPGWTYDEFDAALNSMPEGCTAFGPATSRDGMLEMLTYLNLDRFVDWAAGTCDFESEGFKRMLRFCAQFSTPETALPEEDSSDMLRIAEGRQMLVYSAIYSVEASVYNDQYFAGKSTYIGFPVEEGVGNVLYPSAGFAMSSRCADKEAAWRFLRGFLTEDYPLRSSRGGYGLPLHRGAFQKQLDKAMEVEYQKDAEGHYVLDANGEKIPVAKGGMGLSVGEGIMEFELWAMTPEQAEKLLAAIESATYAADINTSLFAIVKEEAAAYFAGQKSVDEVARLVQSKAKLYISEQS